MAPMTDALEQRFLDLALANPKNRAILERLPALGLADCWLVAGCLFGPVWNARAGQPPEANISDYDVFYWDPDISWDAEDAVIRRAEALFADLGVIHELRNQARVPLWFERHFGRPYPPSSGSMENIGRFIVACTCVGIRPDGAGGHVVHAPCGLEDLFAGILRPNLRNPTPDRFRAKCASYKARWPFLQIEETP